MLFPSIGMAVIDYTCINPSVNIVNLYCCYSNKSKFLIMVSYTILQTLHMLLSENHQTFKIWSPTRLACTFLHAGTGPCTSFYSGSFAEAVTQNINYHKPSFLL